MRSDISFIFGTQETRLTGVAPTLTVLEWLRTHARAIGTKEGCAEGDCGACTVVLGEPAGDGIRYVPVNACLLFVPALDGRQLLTVEHLRGPDGALHPVQAAMVARHASQCGFCTPGIVMSLFAMYQAGRSGREAACEALAGNLCRCTGYRPILDAAEDVCRGAPADDGFAEAAAVMAARLRALPQDAQRLEADGHLYFAPRDQTHLTCLLAEHPDALLLAGGTDLALLVTKQRRRLPKIVALDRVADLACIETRDGVLHLGAGASYADIWPVLHHHWPELGDLLHHLGSRQIRHRGTLGGNLVTASPIGDTPPCLIALDAQVAIRGADGERLVPIDAFFTGYRRTVLAGGEFVSRVELPLPRADEQVRIYKVSKRREEDISSVLAAFRLRLEGGRVRELRAGFGGVAATPLRATALEAAVTGRSWTRQTVEDGMQALDASIAPISDMRASAAYRRAAARNLVLKLWLETSGQHVRTRAAA
jgi:xanthine dehydrogenase small subunit